MRRLGVALLVLAAVPTVLVVVEGVCWARGWTGPVHLFGLVLMEAALESLGLVHTTNTARLLLGIPLGGVPALVVVSVGWHLAPAGGIYPKV